VRPEKGKAILRPSRLSCKDFYIINMSANPQTRNDIAEAFFRYAASNTDQSSYFVKIFKIYKEIWYLNYVKKEKIETSFV
jgi:hypothetical protein